MSNKPQEFTKLIDIPLSPERIKKLNQRGKPLGMVKDLLMTIKMSKLHGFNKVFTKRYYRATTLLDNIGIHTKLDVDAITKQTEIVNLEIEKLINLSE